MSLDRENVIRTLLTLYNDVPVCKKELYRTTLPPIRLMPILKVEIMKNLIFSQPSATLISITCLF
jgi:hypothetical protein